ncbi:unnamed protein product [Arabidopsis arenosa]|uniref:Uncharacterized protein n=1 Tax=Arabidopsis arenosa TaxID=38785 RepID=A0A8S1ZLR2_ARAAE|nr:unnamed protein product [Arabidopsis arenosa]
MNISRDSFTANVTIFNYLKKQKDIEGPWELGWTWYEDEILLSTMGAKVSKQSNVLKFVDCCLHRVTFVDLPQQTDDDHRNVANCCKDGVIPSWFREADLAKSSSSFQITVGQVGIEFHPPPLDLKLTTQGLEYVCDSLTEVMNTPGYLNAWMTTCNLYDLKMFHEKFWISDLGRKLSSFPASTEGFGVSQDIIPSSFANLKTADIVDLSYNNLTLQSSIPNGDCDQVNNFVKTQSSSQPQPDTTLQYHDGFPELSTTIQGGTQFPKSSSSTPRGKAKCSPLNLVDSRVVSASFIYGSPLAEKKEKQKLVTYDHASESDNFIEVKKKEAANPSYSLALSPSSSVKTQFLSQPQPDKILQYHDGFPELSTTIRGGTVPQIFLKHT